MTYTKKTQTTRYDVVIAGGGAAGMFCACELAKSGMRVLIVEPNRNLGRKLRITGKGRCNLTNNCAPDQVIKNTVRNPRFLYSCLNGFSPADIMNWFENEGVELKTERGGRVFPASDRADDIAAAMENLLKRFGCRIAKDRVKRIAVSDLAVAGVECEKATYFTDFAVIATGGKSYPATGSTGDGYEIASMLGHTVVSPEPSLVPIEIKERLSGEITGLALKNVTLSLLADGRSTPLFSQLGELAFERYGISGPLALSASSYMSEAKIASGQYRIEIDLKPGLTPQQLERRIQRDFDDTPSVEFADSLSRLLPLKIIPEILRLSGISPEKKCGQIERQERERLAQLLKHFELTPMRLRPIEEAIITSGGISVKEIIPATMQSKLVKGLYFAGEVIDCDALTGGYNLTIAFSTAYAAAHDIINKSSSRKDNQNEH